jgi:hypothetical protein
MFAESKKKEMEYNQYLYLGEVEQAVTSTSSGCHDN